MGARYTHRLFAAALLAAALSACVHIDSRETNLSAPAAVSPSTISALDDANAAFSAAWMAGDVDALMAAYADDAVVHPPAGGVLTTPAQIRTVWAPIANWRRVGHRLEPTLRQPLGGGDVLEMGRWHSARANEAGEAPWISGCYTVIWRNQGGRWRMRYDSWTAANENDWACRPRG
jgi:ketosteroid isomerase-like protein